MSDTLRRIIASLAVSVLLITVSYAQTGDLNTLNNLLQSELNEISLLTAQYQDLQQRGNTITAATVASYIPDHQMQATMLSAAIRSRGGDPSQVRPSVQTPFTGPRLDVVSNDIRQHQAVMQDYLNVRQSSTNPEIQRLATAGYSGAARHYNSLLIARAAFTFQQSDQMPALLAALTLERSAIADLQTQAAQLNALNDPTSANTLLAMVPQHQAQAQCLEGMVCQLGGNPAEAVPPPAVALANRSDILSHVRTLNTQLVNTYALPIATLPVGNVVRTAALQGQPVALVGLNQLQMLPVV